MTGPLMRANTAETRRKFAMFMRVPSAPVYTVFEIIKKALSLFSINFRENALIYLSMKILFFFRSLVSSAFCRLPKHKGALKARPPVFLNLSCFIRSSIVIYCVFRQLFDKPCILIYKETLYI